MGNLGADPELRVTSGGSAVLKLSLATSERWKDKGGQQQEKTEWHRLVMWGERAEKLSRHLQKGQQILVEGKITYGQYEDRDGNKRYSTDIVIDRLVFCGKKTGGGSSSNSGGPSPYSGGYGDDKPKAVPGGSADIDDIPFGRIDDETWP
jgi:single-strand DNA-binding protein